MTHRVNIKVAADEIGCSVPYLRQQMRLGRWDLGDVVKPGRNGKNYRYFIYRPKLDAKVGIYRKEVQEIINETVS